MSDHGDRTAVAIPLIDGKDVLLAGNRSYGTRKFVRTRDKGSDAIDKPNVLLSLSKQPHTPPDRGQLTGGRAAGAAGYMTGKVMSCTDRKS